MTHVVWDWNGTLLDDLELVVGAVNAVMDDLGGDRITAHDYREHYTRPVSRFYERLLDRPIGPAEWERIDVTYHLRYAASLDRARLADGAESTLREIAARDRSQSLLSMWRHDELVPLVDRVGLGVYFERVDGLRGAGGGPKAGFLARHLGEIGLTADVVLVVGDALDDAAAAREVGARCVLYDGGSHHRRELESAGVPVVGHLSGVLEHL